MSKTGTKKAVAAMLAALMLVNTINSVATGNPVQAAQHKEKRSAQEEEKQKTELKEVTVATPSVPRESEGEVTESEVNAYSQENGHFTVTLTGGGYSVSYMIYMYNIRNLEPAAGVTARINKIESTALPSDSEPQWKAVRLDNNGNDDRAYFDLSFEDLILRHDGPVNNSQGWSGAQIKVKFNIDKHVNQISQSVSDTENGRLCLIASNDSKDSSLESQMLEENNMEASNSCTIINNKLNAHNGGTGIIGYIQCNSYNCGLADFNGDGNYSYGKLNIYFNKGKETLKINPNSGTYTQNNGQTITGTTAKELTTKTCGSSTAINVPVRDGYIFDGWTVTHGTGGNGSYNSSNKKYIHCASSVNGTTTLKANWKRNDVTNTPTPKPTATPTPLPEYIQTVEYYTWSETEQKWKQCKEKEIYTQKKGNTFDCMSLAKKNQPEGYYLSDIIMANAGTTKWNKITQSYVVDTSAIVHINYRPNQSVLQVNPNGGKWNGSREIQSFTQGYGTILAIPTPVRDKYKFKEWSRTGENGIMDSLTESTFYRFGTTAGAIDYITAQWQPYEFTIRYARNEPSEIVKSKMEMQNNLNIESKETIYDVGSYENAKFLGWCLAKGNWNKKTDQLDSVHWLKEDGTFDTAVTPRGEKRFDTTGYAGKVFPNISSVQQLVPYVETDGEELTLVGMWVIDVAYDAGEGTNTAALAAGQHDVIPDITFDLVNEVPSLMGNEFVKWRNLESGQEEEKGAAIEQGYGKNTSLHASYQYYIQYQKADGTVIEKNSVSRQKEFEKKYGEAAEISDVVYPATGNTEGHHYSQEQVWQVITDNSERYKYADASNYPEKNYANSYRQGETAMVNRSVILKAVEEANTYIIKYHANSGGASTAASQDWSKMAGQKLTYGHNVTLKDVSESLLPGYEFSGWNTKADGSGVSFFNRESSTVKQFLNKAGVNVNENGAQIHLYAQWHAKSYKINFNTNRPTTLNNTHESTNVPVLHGTVTMEYVWDSVITNNKIEDINIPTASLKGWHQRFSDSLWYTNAEYDAPGNPLKEGIRFDSELLGTPGDKTVYAQWEANTYTVRYDGNGKLSGGRGIVQGKVEAQKFIYDQPSSLRENKFIKQDEEFRYHDDEKLQENIYGTKYNPNAAENYKYCWLGWCRNRITEREEETLEKQPIITQAEISIEKIWNFTDMDQGEVVLYALWDGIPNITTKTENTHFDRYQGARLNAIDMKGLIKTYDLEQGEELEVSIKNISYYVEDEMIGTVDFPKDDYMLDTTLPETLWEDGKYKTYKITFETVDKYGVKNYMGEPSKKTAVYCGKIYYNNEPVMKPYNGEPSFYERYLYLQDIEKMEEKELGAVLKRQVKIMDKEDEAYEKDKENDLYAGRWSKGAKLEILQLSNLYQQVANQGENWSLQEKEKGKILEYSMRYTDIFGKDVTEKGKLHVIDINNDISGENKKQNQTVRFISKEYFNTLEQDSQWYREEENRKKLENILNSVENSGETYELQKGR